MAVFAAVPGTRRSGAVRRGRNAWAVDRVVYIRVRTLLLVAAIAIAVFALLHVVAIARHVIVWILIALFLAVALNPLVELIQRRTRLRARGLAVATAFVVVLLVIVAIGAAFVPTL